MRSQIKNILIFLVILTIKFKIQPIVCQNSGTISKPNIVSLADLSFNVELDQKSRKTVSSENQKRLNSHSAKKDNLLHNQTPHKKGKTSGDEASVEKGKEHDGDTSWSSSSSSSEESGHNVTTTTPIETTTKPILKLDSTKKSKIIRADKGRLLKPRNVQKKDNWYNIKRSAEVSASASLSLGAGGSSNNVKGGSRVRGGFRGSFGIQRSGTRRIGGSKFAGGKGQKGSGGFGGNGGRGGIRGGTSIRGGGGTKERQQIHHLKQKERMENNQAGDVYQRRKNRLINKSSTHPFSVERVERPVEPDVYSFFQFKPRENLGFLWTQSAGAGKMSMLNESTGSGVEEIGFDEGEHDLGDPSIILDWEFKRYDRACMFKENFVNKVRMNSTEVSDEVTRMVDNQNQMLARKFLDWQFINKEDHETIATKGEGEKHPQYLTFKFLLMTVEIFRDRICRNATPFASNPAVKPFAPAGIPLKAETNKKYIDTKLLPKGFIDDLFRLFLTLRDITLNKEMPDYPTKKNEEEIYVDVLENCLKLDPIHWHSHSCSDQVLSYDNPHNYACTPLIEYDFNYREYDPILDGMWHMFTAVHGFCFNLFNKRNTRLWHKYSMIIINSFTVQMRLRWKASIAGAKFYLRLLGPDHKTHFETMNRCMFAAVLRSGAPAAVPRLLSLAPLTFEREKTFAEVASEPHKT